MKTKKRQFTITLYRNGGFKYNDTQNRFQQKQSAVQWLWFVCVVNKCFLFFGFSYRHDRLDHWFFFLYCFILVIFLDPL